MKFALVEQDIVKALGKGRSRKPFRYGGSAKLLSLQGLYQASTKALMTVGTYEVDMK